MAVRLIDLDQLMKYPLRRGSEHCDEKNADPRFLNGVESILEWAQTLPTLTPQNEPLTIEQLREMDGEPVFVAIDDGIEPLKMWALVDYIAEEQCLTLTNNLGGRSQYYTADDLEIDNITVYRRPPEGEEET